MKRNTINFKNIQSSFLSCDKDTETILRKLFIENQPYSNILKRLLVVQTKDCLENNSEEVLKKLDEMSLNKLRDEKYIRLEPKIRISEHEEMKSYIIITFDNFGPTKTNSPYYRDCIVAFDIICHVDNWDIGNYQLRPIKIAGYIDGILNEAKLSGIGTFNFIGMNQLVLNEDFAGYTLMYRAVHGNDDKIPAEE